MGQTKKISLKTDNVNAEKKKGGKHYDALYLKEREYDNARRM
jgi:hypothetical protein